LQFYFIFIAVVRTA